MQRRDLKKKIYEAYRSEVPDLRERILEDCKREAQMPREEKKSIFERTFGFNTALRRTVAVALCLMLFISGLSVGVFLPEGVSKDGGGVETFVYLDVNPSIELRMDSQNRIIEVIAGNEDARAVLADLELGGVDMNTALTAVVGSMYVKGYLTEAANSILISVSSQNEANADGLLVDITDKINTVFERSNMQCSVIAQCVSVDDELRSNADKYGVSVGKMYLLEKMVRTYENLSPDAISKLSEMSINDLSLIYSQKPESDEGSGHEYISGSANVSLKAEEALERVLSRIGKTSDDLVSVSTFLTPSKGKAAKVAYGVNLELAGDSNIYRYEVDCESGEVYIILTFATLTSEGIVYKDVLFSPQEAATLYPQ